MAISLRRSFDTIAEERNARQILENNYKFQTENVLQLNGRLKRAEDTLQEDRSAMQSLIVYTRNLEQSMQTAQKDLFIRRDFQAQRLEDLKIQIDDLQHSKDTLERSASSLLEEIKQLKNKVDLESLNLNSISGDLRNKTRRLEDESRQHVNNREFCLFFLILIFSMAFYLLNRMKNSPESKFYSELFAKLFLINI